MGRRSNRQGRLQGSQVVAQPQSAAGATVSQPQAGAAGVAHPQAGAATVSQPQAGAAGAAQPVLQPPKQGRGNEHQLTLKRKSISLGRAHGSQPVSQPQEGAAIMSLPQPGPATG